MARRVAFANQKGGVGKTTTAVNLGACLAERGKRVLLVDFDPQANTASSLGADRNGSGIYQVIMDGIALTDVIQRSPVDGLDLVPASIDLAGAAVELVDKSNRDGFLARALGAADDLYDYTFIDCPPSLGILTLNALVAAREVFIPLQCEYFALEGLSLLLQTIRRVQEGANRDLRIGGILFTMYDSRTRLSHEVVEEVTGYFKEKVFRTIIPRNIRLGEAPSFGQPITMYDTDCVGATSYRKLAEEVLAHDDA